jgi:hypothetical protein
MWKMVRRFCRRHPGLMKKLLLDRGFINGPQIAYCKQQLGVDTIIGLRKNMDIYQDLMGLVKFADTPWQNYPLPEDKPQEAHKQAEAKPAAIVKRQAKRRQTLESKKQQQLPPDPAKQLIKCEVVGFDDLRSWQDCPIPLSAGVMRRTYADGHQDQWALATTQRKAEPVGLFQTYGLRPKIEERHKQYKCFWKVTKFPSTAYNHVANQIVFVLMTYSFLQIYNKRQQLGDLNPRTIQTIRRILEDFDTTVVIYHQDHVAFLKIPYYTRLLLDLKEKPRRKIRAKTTDMWGELLDGW